MDANNLYGWAINQYLPYSGFEWFNWKEIDKLNVNRISKNSLHGYILKFDLEYTNELHEVHNVYSIAPEKLEISCGMLSKNCSDSADEYGIKVVVLINKFQT